MFTTSSVPSFQASRRRDSSSARRRRVARNRRLLLESLESRLLLTNTSDFWIGGYADLGNTGDGGPQSMGLLSSLMVDPPTDPNGLIAGRVWQDGNGNGLQEPGEPGVAGIAVELFSTVNAVIGDDDDFSFGTKITSDDGRYAFTELPAWDN